MKRRMNKILLSLHCLTSIVLILVFITTSHGTFGIDVFEANRGVTARVVSNDKAFVGLIYDEVYQIVYPNDGSNVTVSMYVKNNLPYEVEYELDLSGKPIKDFSPRTFTLDPNKQKEIKIQMLDLEEATEGVFDVEGIILAEFDDGRIDVEFQFEVDIELPEPELVENEVLGMDKAPEENVENVCEENADKTIENEINPVDVKVNNENKDNSNEKQEADTTSNEDLPSESEDNSNINNSLNDLMEEIDTDNDNDEITENPLPNTIEKDDDSLKSNIESIETDKAIDVKVINE